MAAETKRKTKGARVKSKPKSKEKVRKTKPGISANRVAEHVTTIGYRVPKLSNATSFRGYTREDLAQRLGGKGAGLANMVKMKVPVPPAFNLSTELCQMYLLRQTLPEAVLKNYGLAMAGLEKTLGRAFGDSENPLLVSVRSGAPISMPGMMDTILNLGLNTKITESLAASSNDQGRFWWDCYRRLILMFIDVVLGQDKDPYEDFLFDKKRERGVQSDSQLSGEDLKSVAMSCLERLNESGLEFPQDVWAQLQMAIEAVFKSWNTERAIHYREINSIPSDWGTAVNVQAMVFGNRNNKSATGVVFSRNPSTGEKKIYGEYLVNAQGEDVVAGVRTPKPIEEMKRELPKSFRELSKLVAELEKRFNEVQDIEFTIDSEELFILQTRNAKRTAAAAITHSVQFVKEKRLTQKEALARIQYSQIDQLLHPSLKETDETPIAKGLPASPGAVSGLAAFDAETAVKLSRAEQRVILIRRETSPEDIMGMSASQGILTATGGMTSHAAVVGRGMGKACVVGCTELNVNESLKTAQVGSHTIKEGDLITIDGGSGTVYLGELATASVSWNQDAKKFFDWTDQLGMQTVLANADTPTQAELARSLGAQGIGLCRTEHMFFERDRLREFRKMILADSRSEREKYLKNLLPHQQSDFQGIFAEMKGLSVCVRLLDPPLHEFLPKPTDVEEIESLAAELGISVTEIQARIEKLQELNPMLGHRGCRLGISSPEIYRMQVRALALALAENWKKSIKTQLKIMIPLIIDAKELEFLLSMLKQEFSDALQVSHAKIATPVSKMLRWGTMIELPRACVTADKIAPLVDFISFGTNDLTQTTCGISRDDAQKFIPTYLENGIFENEPFESLDIGGVGQLVKMAVEKARKVKPKIDVGVCGEHGGDPKSIEFFHDMKFDSISCSPYRVPTARLASARAATQARKRI